MIFFIDRSLGEDDVPGALRAAGATVAVHSDLFAPDAPDVLWLTECGRRGYVVLTKDDRIRLREIERRAIIKSKARAFFLASKNLTGQQNGQIFVRALGRIRRACTGNPGPFIAMVYAPGAVRGLYRPKR